MNLVEERQMIRDVARKIAKEHLAPQAAKVDKEGVTPWAGYKNISGKRLIRCTCFRTIWRCWC